MLLRPGVNCDKAIRFLDDLVQGGLNDVRNSVPNFAQPMLAGVEPSKLVGVEIARMYPDHPGQRTVRQRVEAVAIVDRQLRIE